MGNLLRYHYRLLICTPTLLVVPAAFLLNAVIAGISNDWKLPYSGLKSVAFLLYLPTNPSFDLVRWLLILTPYLLITGLFLHDEFTGRFVNVSIQSKRSTLWLDSFLIVMTLFITVGTILGFCINMMAGFLINDGGEAVWMEGSMFEKVNAVNLLVREFILMNGSAMIAVLTNILLTLLFRNMGVATLLTVTSIIVSFAVARLATPLIPWLPINMGLTAFNEIQPFSLFHGTTVSVAMIVILIALIRLVFRYRLESLFIEGLKQEG